MHKNLRAALLVSALLPLAHASAQDTRDDNAMRAIIADQVVAWNAGDGTRYAISVSPEASFTNAPGMVTYGAPAFAARHNEILATVYKGTRRKHLVRRIRFLTPDVAVVDIDTELRGVTAMPAGIAMPADGVIRTQLMQVFARHDGRWWIEAYHAADVMPAAKR